MESREAVPKGKSCNQHSRELLVCQTTEELKTWKLNEQQQQIVDASGLGNLIHTADLIIDCAVQPVLRAFCELWSKETNTARFYDFEMAPSLRDTAYILGIPVVGHAVTTGAVLNMSSEQLFLQYLGQAPDCSHYKGSRVKLSWLHSKFSQLSEHPTDEEIVYGTRAYLLYLIGATLFPEKERGYVSPKYLPLLSDFDKVREYAWGAAALAHLYRALSTVMSTAIKRLTGSAALLMGWIYEYIPEMRPDTDDAPAHVFPRVCRWRKRAISQPANEVLDIRKAFSHLRVSDVNWEPYKHMDPASIPNICVAPDIVCCSRTWLISFNVREVHVPDRFARQFGQEQHQLNDVLGHQRRQWKASVDWSLEYASEIKLFEQLVSATRHDHTTVPATCNTTKRVFTSANTAQEFHDLNLRTVVESIKEEFGTIMRFLEPQSFRSEVATSFARIRELLEAAHLKEGNVDSRGGGTSEPVLTTPHPPVIPACEQAATGTTDDQTTVAQAVEPVPDEGMQNDSDQPAPQCRDTPREQDVADVSGTLGEEGAVEWRESSEEEDNARIRDLREASSLRMDPGRRINIYRRRAKKGNVATSRQQGVHASQTKAYSPGIHHSGVGSRKPNASPLSHAHLPFSASHLTEGNVAIDSRGEVSSRPDLTAPHPPVIPVGKQGAAGTMGSPATAQAREPVPDEGMQNGSDQPASECCDTPREQAEGDISGTPGEEEAVEWRLSKCNVAVDAQGGGTSRRELTAPHPPVIPVCEQAATDTTGSPAREHMPDEPMQTGSDHPTPASCDTPREEEVGDASGTPGEEEAPEENESSEEDVDERGDKGRKRTRQYAERRGGGLRRSNRRCVQVKRFKHKGGKGSVASDPIVL
ncbi:uncharacterized protein [Lolium perenne]|uniref:uncharacterized protein n=1 Tax=Lolium perenne TaxID=4522 RepID=UPI0021F665CF|nr:uncharacterized protein LOC127333369 isoform X1 [Lolium perenne]XP_051215722.1 uncharacterized protein LOC127333369 isoform X1 [Lolium perenne]